jgi:predicted ester cyclase
MQFKDGQTVVQGNRAAILWTAQGTHQGYLLNIPPTGRTFAVRGVSFLTIANNQIQRGEYIWDLAELLRCIRLLPELHENDSGQR